MSGDVIDYDFIEREMNRTPGYTQLVEMLDA